MYDECMYDTYLCDPQSLILIHVCMMHISVMRVKFYHGPTDRQADSRRWIGKNMFHLETFKWLNTITNICYCIQPYSSFPQNHDCLACRRYKKCIFSSLDDIENHACCHCLERHLLSH